MKTSEVFNFVKEQRANGLTDSQISKLVSKFPKIGDKKIFFHKRFIYSGNCWTLDEICHNVISPKNVENSGYRIHSYSL
jgi:hypothetical protein